MGLVWFPVINSKFAIRSVRYMQWIFHEVTGLRVNPLPAPALTSVSKYDSFKKKKTSASLLMLPKWIQFPHTRNLCQLCIEFDRLQLHRFHYYFHFSASKSIDSAKNGHCTGVAIALVNSWSTTSCEQRTEIHAYQINEYIFKLKSDFSHSM